MWLGGSTFSPRFLKNISSDLSGSALSPALISQLVQMVYPSRMDISMSSQFHPHAKMAPSSTYIPSDAFAHSLIL
jgi:hypothetical protein